jgi:polysaccharide biosynthesis/export protein
MIGRQLSCSRYPRALVLSVGLAVTLQSGVFAREPQNAGSGATPPLPAAAASFSRENYRIGPGDIVEIRVLGEEQMGSPATKVSEEGFIRSPFIDEDIRAQCLTERQLSQEISARLKKYLKYPEVYVSVKEYNASPVAIIGAVNQPSRFSMQRKMRLIEMLTYAGGVRDGAGKVLHIVHVGSGGAACDAETAAGPNDDPTETVNLAKLLEGDLKQDRIMRPGDIVIVPNADMVFIAGEVLKPNAYPLREGMTLTQALALAGGPSAIAKTTAIRIVRQEPGKPKAEINVDLKAVQANKAPDPLLFANDVIEIPDSSGKKFFRNFVSAISGTAAQLPVRAVPY